MTSAYVSKTLRRRVTERARRRCGYCLIQETIMGMPIEIERLYPRSLGGVTSEDNLWLACPLCNKYMGSRIGGGDPKTDRVVRLFNPRSQSWSDHFRWLSAGARIAGVTAVGRATVEVLRLNQEARVVARRAWIATGWHPPAD